MSTNTYTHDQAEKTKDEVAQSLAKLLGPLVGQALTEHLLERFIILPRFAVVCATHDGVPSTEEEEAYFEEGGDPCQFVVRVE